MNILSVLDENGFEIEEAKIITVADLFRQIENRYGTGSNCALRLMAVWPGLVMLKPVERQEVVLRRLPHSQRTAEIMGYRSETVAQFQRLLWEHFPITHSRNLRIFVAATSISDVQLMVTKDMALRFAPIEALFT